MLLKYPHGQLASSLFIRAFQACYWGAAGLYFPFVNVYYRGIGLSGTEIGLIATLSALMGALGAVIWGMIHDRWGKSRLVFTGLAFGAALFSFILGHVREYWQILPAAALVSFFNTSAVSQVDSMTLRLLGENHAAYSSHRLWGTVCFVVTSALASLLLPAVGIQSVFTLFPIGLLLFWLFSLRLKDQSIRQGPSLLAGLGQMTRNPQWLLLMGSVMVLWTAILGVFAFISVVAKDLGASEASVGLISTVAAVAEIPMLLIGPYLLRRFGPRSLIVGAMAAYVVRMLLYAQVARPEWVIALSLMQGITYSPFLIGTVALANQLAPDELKSTSQGLLGMVMSLSNVAGGLACGWLFDHTGQAGLFSMAALFAGAALLLYGLGARRLNASQSVAQLGEQ